MSTVPMMLHQGSGVRLSMLLHIYRGRLLSRIHHRPTIMLHPLILRLLYLHLHLMLLLSHHLLLLISN